MNATVTKPATFHPAFCTNPVYHTVCMSESTPVATLDGHNILVTAMYDRVDNASSVWAGDHRFAVGEAANLVEALISAIAKCAAVAR